MVLLVIPDCRECKTSKNVKMDSAYTDDKTRFLITYCTKCFSVMSCEFSAKLMKSSKNKEARKR